jgi:hypothetical protein
MDPRVQYCDHIANLELERALDSGVRAIDALLALLMPPLDLKQSSCVKMVIHTLAPSTLRVLHHQTSSQCTCRQAGLHSSRNEVRPVASG